MRYFIKKVKETLKVMNMSDYEKYLSEAKSLEDLEYRQKNYRSDKYPKIHFPFM